jgi:hypothetical protein
MIKIDVSQKFKNTNWMGKQENKHTYMTATKTR